MTINKIQDQIITEFQQFDDWLDRYELLIDYGNSLPQIDKKLKIPQNLIEGCQSRVWINAELDEDKNMILQGDSDTVLVKGIVALLIQIYSNQSPKDILDNDLYFIEKIGLQEHLSPTRSNGLLAMIKQIKLYAMVFKMQLEKQN